MLQGDKIKLIPIIDYLEKELLFITKYKNEIDWNVYESVREKILEVERWIECIINATLDISKMILTLRKEDIPETSREILFKIAALIYEEDTAEAFSKLAKIRNTLAHRYLDIRWHDIKSFLQTAQDIYPPFLKYVKKEVES